MFKPISITNYNKLFIQSISYLITVNLTGVRPYRQHFGNFKRGLDNTPFQQCKYKDLLPYDNTD
jgi:hypothetical protein